MAEADARIAQARTEAMGHVRSVASDTARTVTARLIGVDASDDAVGVAVDAAVAGSK